ncbi:MAG TPA: hypothetical protein DD423_05345 [Opitutae bacterium]|nr:hypothetical protein [Opitutae bacterium]
MGTPIQINPRLIKTALSSAEFIEIHSTSGAVPLKDSFVSLPPNKNQTISKETSATIWKRSMSAADLHEQNLI